MTRSTDMRLRLRRTSRRPVVAGTSPAQTEKHSETNETEFEFELPGTNHDDDDIPLAVDELIDCSFTGS